jgi:hypothetical protein
MARPLTVTPKIINIMNTNSNACMDDVVDIIMGELNLKENEARSYYMKLVRSGKAKGIIERKKERKIQAKEFINKITTREDYVFITHCDIIDPDFDDIYTEDENDLKEQFKSKVEERIF